MKRVCTSVCTLFVLFSLSSDFLVLPGFIDFKAEEVVSINPTYMYVFRIQYRLFPKWVGPATYSQPVTA